MFLCVLQVLTENSRTQFTCLSHTDYSKWVNICTSSTGDHPSLNLCQTPLVRVLAFYRNLEGVKDVFALYMPSVLEESMNVKVIDTNTLRS